jgi:hypothetical protein
VSIAVQRLGLAGPAAGRAERQELRCNRCDRVGGRIRRLVEARLHLCDECLPGFESALAMWRARTAGAHDDSVVPLAPRPAPARGAVAPTRS